MRWIICACHVFTTQIASDIIGSFKQQDTGVISCFVVVVTLAFNTWSISKYTGSVSTSSTRSSVRWTHCVS